MNCGNENNCGVYAEGADNGKSRCNGTILYDQRFGSYYNTSIQKHCGYLVSLNMQGKSTAALEKIAEKLGGSLS